MPLPARELPEAGEVHLWFLDLGQLAATLSSAFGDDKTPSQMTLNSGQARFARRFYLRLLLGSYLGLPGKDVIIKRTTRGKPLLDTEVHSSKLQFSMAKSGDCVLVGVASEIPMGVDLEPSARKVRNGLLLARRYFSGAEAEALARLPEEQQNEAFLRAWACKEAVVKAYGEGIANQLCRFTVELDPMQAPAMLDFDGSGNSDWKLALLQPDEDHIAAIAMHHGDLRPSCFRLVATQ